MEVVARAFWWKWLLGYFVEVVARVFLVEVIA